MCLKTRVLGLVVVSAIFSDCTYDRFSIDLLEIEIINTEFTVLDFNIAVHDRHFLPRASVESKIAKGFKCLAESSLTFNLWPVVFGTFADESRRRKCIRSSLYGSRIFELISSCFARERCISANVGSFHRCK